MRESVRSLSDTQCRKTVDQWLVPKFASLCFFRLNSIPHLDAVLIERDTPLNRALTIVNQFAAYLGSREIMWRSDGRTEHKEYRQGGITLPIDVIASAIETLLAAKRDVILLEPLNRFSHLKSFSAVLTADGTLIVECLGAGYDASDLQRGHVLPEVVVRGELETGLISLKTLRQTPISAASMDDRIRQRLLNLGQNIISKELFGRHVGESHMEYAERYLRYFGHSELFEKRPLRVTPADLRTICSASEVIYSHFISRRRWSVLSFNFVKTRDRGYIFWDIFNATAKYGMSQS